MMSEEQVMGIQKPRSRTDSDYMELKIYSSIVHVVRYPQLVQCYLHNVFTNSTVLPSASSPPSGRHS